MLKEIPTYVAVIFVTRRLLTCPVAVFPVTTALVLFPASQRQAISTIYLLSAERPVIVQVFISALVISTYCFTPAFETVTTYPPLFGFIFHLRSIEVSVQPVCLKTDMLRSSALVLNSLRASPTIELP